MNGIYPSSYRLCSKDTELLGVAARSDVLSTSVLHFTGGWQHSDAQTAFWSRSSSVDVVTKLPPGRSSIICSSPERGKTFSVFQGVQTECGAHPATHSLGAGGHCPGFGPCGKITIYLNLVARSLSYVSITYRGTHLKQFSRFRFLFM